MLARLTKISAENSDDRRTARTAKDGPTILQSASKCRFIPATITVDAIVASHPPERGTLSQRYMPRKRTPKKTSLMGINFSRDKKLDMSQVLESNDLDGIAEYDLQPRPPAPFSLSPFSLPRTFS